MKRPDPSEYHEYYGTYIDRVPEGDIFGQLAEENERTMNLLRDLSDAGGAYRYEPGKWSIKEVVGHLIDTERTFAYRALSFARADAHALPGIEQDEWAAGSNAGSRSLHDLLDEFEAVRRANILLFKSFDAEMATRRGTASDCEFTVRAFPYIILGHEIHHRGVLEERYIDLARSAG